MARPEYEQPLEGLGLVEVLKAVTDHLASKSELPGFLEPVPVRRSEMSLVVVPRGIRAVPMGRSRDELRETVSLEMSAQLIVTGEFAGTETFLAEALQGAMRIAILLAKGFQVDLPLDQRAACAFEAVGGRFFDADDEESNVRLYEALWEGTITVPYTVPIDPDSLTYILPEYLFEVRL